MEVYDPPKTPIETAKAAAEEAWGNITLTNHYKFDDLKNDMEEAVKAALTEAGVDTTDVTVEVPFTKFQNIGATGDAEGSVSATVQISVGGESIEITVNRTFDLISCGMDWELDRYGKLTVRSEEGLSGWEAHISLVATHFS